MTTLYHSNADLYGPDALNNPYPIYDDLREGGPVAYLDRLGMYALTRFAHVEEALKLPEVFSSGQGVMMNDAMNEATKEIMLCADGDRHNGMRRLFQRPLMPKSLLDIKEQITEMAEDLAERLVAQGSFDAVTDLAHYLPVTIISRLVGLPEEGRQNMMRWAADGFDCFGPMSPRLEQAFASVQESVGYIRENNHPGKVKPGSWTDQLHQTAKAAGLPPEAAVMMGLDYMGPSLDTTIFAISSGVALFAENPDEWDKLRADPSLLPSAINEIIRVESPIQGFSRVTSADHTFEGIAIPADERVVVLYGAANRDPRKWESPEQFIIDRPQLHDQLGFGRGPHTCAGSNLAKLEMTAIFTALLPRVARFEVGEGTRAVNSVLRGYTQLPVTIH